jgi:hypothetical protein
MWSKTGKPNFLLLSDEKTLYTHLVRRCCPDRCKG